MSPRSQALAVAVVTLSLAAPNLARAVLRDRGPVVTTTGFPAWYRDQGGTALELCLAQTPSPNASAGGAPMCFPWVPDPAGFPGNFGGEQFYLSAGASLAGPGFSARLDLALEAAYLDGTPIRGDEMVFARVRIVLGLPAPGTYIVIHPYGSETFTADQAGSRAVTFTRDVGLVAGAFDDALAGPVGPFLEWDVAPGEVDPTDGQPISLVVGTESYLGDPNILHAVKGSPFGTNFLRVIGPAGVDLDGLGGNVAETPLFALVGKRYLAPIPTATQVDRAVFQHDGVTAQVDVFAQSAPGQSLVLAGPGIPTTAFAGDGNGRYLAHVAYEAAGAPPPREGTVTNLSDTPPSSSPVIFTDAVTIWSAIYDPTTGLLTVTAYSSDAHDPTGPALALASPPAGVMSPMDGNPSIKTIAVPMGAPPPIVTVASSSGGSESAPVRVAPTAAIDPALTPIAIDDVAVTAEDTPANIAVLANDLPPSGTVILLGSPAHGAATVDALTGDVLYVPTLNFAGEDTIAYLVMNDAGAFSNPATLAITVTPVNDPPIAVNDNATTQAGTSVTIAVLANDSDVDGAIAPATVAIVAPPANGSAVANADGTITYTPAGAFSGTDAFRYTVQDDAGATSNAATVTVTALGAQEVLTIQKSQYEARKLRWVVSGTSSVFGPNITNSVTIYDGPSTAYPAMATVPIDATGKFQWQPAAGSAPPPDPSNLITIRSTAGGQITVPVQVR